MTVFLILSVMSSGAPLMWLNLNIHVTMTLNIIKTYCTYRMLFHQEGCLHHRHLSTLLINFYLIESS